MAEDMLLSGLGSLVDGLKGILPDKDGDGKPDLDLNSILGVAKGLLAEEKDATQAGKGSENIPDMKTGLEDIVKGLSKIASKGKDEKQPASTVSEKAPTVSKNSSGKKITSVESPVKPPASKESGGKPDVTTLLTQAQSLLKVVGSVSDAKKAGVGDLGGMLKNFL